MTEAERQMVVFVNVQGDPLFTTGVLAIPRVGDIVSYSLEASDRLAWNPEALEHLDKISGKEWKVVKRHHIFRRMDRRTTEKQVLYVYLEENPT